MFETFLLNQRKPLPSQDVQRAIPVDYTGDGNLPPRVLDMSAIPAAVPVGGMVGMLPGMMEMPSAKRDQEVGDQIKADITVGGKKNKTHYGKKFGKKHKSAMLDFTKSLWMQDAVASLRNVLKSEVRQLHRISKNPEDRPCMCSTMGVARLTDIPILIGDCLGRTIVTILS